MIDFYRVICLRKVAVLAVMSVCRSLKRLKTILPGIANGSVHRPTDPGGQRRQQGRASLALARA